MGDLGAGLPSHDILLHPGFFQELSYSHLIWSDSKELAQFLPVNEN